MRPLASAVVMGAALHMPIGQSMSVITIAQGDTRLSYLEAPSSAISADGRFVAFSSYTSLAPADTDTTADIYVFDRAEGRVTLESVEPTGEVSARDSLHPDISGDGRFLVFEIGGTVALRDRREATTRILGEGRQPAISDDGSVVVFGSHANDIVPGPDANGHGHDIYLVEVATGAAKRVNVDGSGGQPAIGSSFNPSVSADGRYVAFSSTAPLTAPVSTRPGDMARQLTLSSVYVRDMRLGNTRAIGSGTHRRTADDDNWGAAISADGRYLAFVSTDASLASGDRNRLSDVFLADLQAGSIELVSRSVSNGSGNGPSRSPAISSDGRFVAFQSLASDLICAGVCSAAVEDINLLWDVFLFDRRTRTMVRLSTDSAGEWMETSAGPAIDAAGDIVAFSSRHPIDVTDRMNDYDLFVVRRQSSSEYVRAGPLDPPVKPSPTGPGLLSEEPGLQVQGSGGTRVSLPPESTSLSPTVCASRSGALMPARSIPGAGGSTQIVRGRSEIRRGTTDNAEPNAL